MNSIIDLLSKFQSQREKSNRYFTVLMYSTIPKEKPTQKRPSQPLSLKKNLLLAEEYN